MESQSVVAAMRCAIEVRQGMLERNSGVPQDHRIEFRIGKIAFDVEDAGERTLKNIVQPLHVYRIVVDPLGGPG